MEETVLDISLKQIEQWLILINDVKYVQHNQHSIENYALEMKAPDVRYSTNMYKRLQVTERDVKRIDFKPDPEILRQNYLDVFEELNQKLCTQPSMTRIVTLVKDLVQPGNSA